MSDTPDIFVFYGKEVPVSKLVETARSIHKATGKPVNPNAVIKQALNVSTSGGGGTARRVGSILHTAGIPVTRKTKRYENPLKRAEKKGEKMTSRAIPTGAETVEKPATDDYIGEKLDWYVYELKGFDAYGMNLLSTFLAKQIVEPVDLPVEQQISRLQHKIGRWIRESCSAAMAAGRAGFKLEKNYVLRDYATDKHGPWFCMMPEKIGGAVFKVFFFSEDLMHGRSCAVSPVPLPHLGEPVGERK